MTVRGIEVTTEVIISDPRQLGHHIAGMSSHEQAEVFGGFARGIDELHAVAGGNQLLWIAESLSGRIDRATVIGVLSTLLAQAEAVVA